MKALYFFPRKHLMLSLPLALVLAIIIGLNFNTSWMASTILIATMLMIFPTMIGIQWRALFNLSEKKQISYAMLINFVIVPIIALILGYLFFNDEPLLFAGLMLIALLPTSGMTISWTSISNGNVSAAIKLTVIGLLLGAILAPFYLQLMVGQIVNIQMLSIMRTILTVVFIPLLLGFLATMLMKTRLTTKQINKKIKPNLQPISLWAMHYLIFASMSMRADMIINNWELIGLSVVVLILFYAVLFLIVTWIAKRSFVKEDALSLIYGTTLRNLSIAMGIGLTTFGVEAALLITIAFMLQQQMVVIYNRVIIPKVFPEDKQMASKEA